ncbi:bifunctional isocitrate dehydrogenase kinase/phosphatase [Oligella urethralis]|uniref:bifunctional isocitrate dehydrogenase kinase/phosphatase n=1 Tax=Oligella urethralis TaxID=90245 RepID=UPI000CFEB9E1|nr:bifunctional isocitrate dehydrogenase kinase/phosphatase [Oligella urethralis]AVL71598.1 bifunctional isocitrate dehydrogenase kinase/phosphatase [Oligella urethralis]
MASNTLPEQCKADPELLDVAQAIAETILRGFNKHYRIFRSFSAHAKEAFENRDWQQIQRLVADRIQVYDARVSEAISELRQHYHEVIQHEETWRLTKTAYIALLVDHYQPELAETFFNSVSTKLLDKAYYRNQFIFVKPAAATEYLESDRGTFKSFYPVDRDLRACFSKVLDFYDWQVPFADQARDVERIYQALLDYLGEGYLLNELNLHIQVLQSPFYRNKCGYIMGQVINGHARHPFAIAIMHNAKGELEVDTALFNPQHISVLFSFARAYFLVSMDVPSGYVNFLLQLMPMRNKADMYAMLGLHKQSKNIFWRDFLQHLHYSEDQFILAPGIKGLVMTVFTLPSFPFVFKVIKDKFGPNKDFDQDYVRAKYLLVKKHDRVGRMADTLEYSNVALPRHRCSEEMIQELRELAPSQLEETEHFIVVRHCYVERRLKPLNMYLLNATDEEKERVIIDYGNALKELASANIFPGDMLFKNFGLTRFGRVIFYDYDEIEYMTDCHFRDIPPAPYPELEMSGEVWYPVDKYDVFPEEFGAFLLGDPVVRKTFMQHHSELLTSAFWQGKKERIQNGQMDDFYPYPEEVRFRNGDDGKTKYHGQVED